MKLPRTPKNGVPAHLSHLGNCLVGVLHGTYSEVNAVEALNKILQDHNFTGNVSESVCECFKDNDCDSQKCELAAAAIILQANIKNIIAAYGDSTQAQTIQINCVRQQMRLK